MFAITSRKLRFIIGFIGCDWIRVFLRVRENADADKRKPYRRRLDTTPSYDKLVLKLLEISSPYRAGFDREQATDFV